LLEGIEPELAAWREALCKEGFEARLVEEIPSALDALWKDGVDPTGLRGRVRRRGTPSAP